MNSVVLTSTALALILSTSANLMIAGEVRTKGQLWAVRFNAAAFVCFAVGNGWLAIEPFL
jgi:Na+/H+ antiporter NhaC